MVKTATGFSSEDVLNRAPQLGLHMSRAEAERFIQKHAKMIDDVATRAGNDYIIDLLLEELGEG